jgi:hypothetical protein
MGVYCADTGFKSMFTVVLLCVPVWLLHDPVLQCVAPQLI